MLYRRFTRINPGDSLSAVEFNRRSVAAASSGRITGPGVSRGHAGRLLRRQTDRGTGRIVDGPDQHGLYSLVEIVEQVDPVTGRITWRDRDGGWQGNPKNLPAIEYNDNLVVPGTRVRWWRADYAEFLLFKYCCEGVPGSGSGAEESGSGSGEGSGSGSGSGAGGSGGGGCDPPPTDTTLYLSFTQTGDTPSFCDCITSPIVMTYNPAGALGPGWYGSTAYFWPCHIAPGFLWSIDVALVNCCGASLCGDSFCELVVNFTGQSCTTISTISCVRARRPLLHTFDFFGSSNCADPCGGGTTWQFTLTE